MGEYDITVVEKANSLTVATFEDIAKARDLGELMKLYQKEVEDHHNEAISEAHEQHKRLLAMRDKLLVPAKSAHSALKRAIAGWYKDWVVLERQRASEAPVGSPSSVPQQPPKVKGVVVTTDVTPIIVDEMKLLKAIAAGKLPKSLISFNVSKLKQRLKDGEDLPGVVGEPEISIRL